MNQTVKIRQRELLNPISDNIWMWSVFSEEKELFFNGYALQSAKGLILVDPPSAGEALFHELCQIAPPIEIVLTNRDHERESHALRMHFRIPVSVHEKDAPLLFNAPDKTFRDRDFLSDGLRVVHLAHQKSPGECAFYFPEGLSLIVGDAVIGKPKGQLSMLPPDKYENLELAVKGLKAGFTEYLKESRDPFDRLLVGDGEPFLENGEAVLNDFLQSVQ